VCEKKIGTNRRLKAGYREGALGREWSKRRILSLPSSNPVLAHYFSALSLQPWTWIQNISPKHWLRPTKPQGAKTQDKTNAMLRYLFIGRCSIACLQF
jgi:hypothetical protein